MAVTTTTATRARTTSVQGRLTADVLLAALVVVALVVIAASSGTRTTPPTVTRTVVVSSGQTLWALASANPVDGLSIEQTIDMIVRMNALDGGDVSVGQTLILPASADSAALAMR